MRVLYAGSFDPFHDGHLAVVEQAAARFDEVVVAAVVNPNKTSTTVLADRAAEIERRLDHLPNVTVVSHVGLTTDLAAALEVDALLRGAARDHLTELEMAYANETASGIPTLFLPSRPETQHISSTAIRTERATTER